MTSKQPFEQVHKHEYAERVIPSTCSERGYTLHVCECGDEYKDNFQPLSDHDFRPAGETAPTCEAPGKRFFACSVCGAKKETPIPATGHTFGETETMVYPGCVSEGEGKRICTVCGAVKKVPIPATGHKFDEWFDQKKAGCDAPGEQVRQCPLCGKTETRAVPALGHDMTEWAVSKTDPNKDERFCRRCGLTETREGQDAVTLCADGIAALQNGDRDAAREKLRLAAEKGLAQAQFNYALYCLLGLNYDGTCPPEWECSEETAKEAIEWFQKAADQGIAEATYQIGWAYETVLHDDKQALKWYQKATEAGNAGAKKALAKAKNKRKSRIARCIVDSCILFIVCAYLVLTLIITITHVFNFYVVVFEFFGCATLSFLVSIFGGLFVRSYDGEAPCCVKFGLGVSAHGLVALISTLIAVMIGFVVSNLFTIIEIVFLIYFAKKQIASSSQTDLT